MSERPADTILEPEDEIQYVEPDAVLFKGRLIHGTLT
jgi:hypothetical protein